MRNKKRRKPKRGRERERGSEESATDDSIGNGNSRRRKGGRKELRVGLMTSGAAEEIAGEGEG